MLRGINRLQIPKNRFYITKSPMEITYKKYNTTIYFSGSDGIDDTKGIIDEDKPIKLVILDELTEFFDDGEGEDELANIEATFVRGNKAGFQMIYLYNPPKNPNAPVNLWCKKMEKRPDCIHIHTDYRDVPVDWLGQDLINSAEAMKAVDPKMYRWTWLGEPVGVDELIYYMFSDRHRQKPEEGRSYERAYIGGDYGQQNATTYQAFGLDTYRQKFPGLGEYYHSGRESGTQRSPSEYAQDLIGVRKYCFKLGLYRQGMMHDLSKYSPSEFIPGVKYYQDGHRSPNNAQREDEGVSKAWLHHKGRNKHHFEYWIDYDVEGNSTILAGMKMPVKYVAEMFCDRVAASRIYNKDKYKDSDPLDYYIKGLGHYIMHPETDELLHNLLKMLADKGEEYTFAYIKANVLKK